MFIASLKDGDSPVIPSTAECINSHIYTAEYYSAIKRNELLIHATAWKQLKNMLGEIKK